MLLSIDDDGSDVKVQEDGCGEEQGRDGGKDVHIPSNNLMVQPRMSGLVSCSSKYHIKQLNSN